MFIFGAFLANIIINHLNLRDMKKMFLMLAAVAGLALTSCKDNKKPEEAVKEGAEKIEEIANEGAAEAVDAATLGDELAKGLEASDGEGLKGKIDQAKAYATQLLSEGKGEQAKGIIEKIQNFLSENADKVKGVIGDNEYVQGALDWVKGIDAGQLVDKAKDALGVEGAGEAVDAAKDAAVDKAAAAAEAVKDAPAKAAEAAEAVKDAAVEKGNEAIESAKEAVKAAPEAAKEAAAEAVEKGKEAVKEAAKDAVDKGIEKVGGLLKK